MLKKHKKTSKLICKNPWKSLNLPRTVSDLLILDASLSLSPEAPVDFCLSEPAKSTKWSFEFFTWIMPFVYTFDWKFKVNTECERLESAFILVEPTCLEEEPKKKPQQKNEIFI